MVGLDPLSLTFELVAGRSIDEGVALWQRTREGTKLVEATAAALARDAGVPTELREPLAAAVRGKWRTQPSTQAAIALLLEGGDTETPATALAACTAALCRAGFEWTDAFGAEEFGALAAAHAVVAVNGSKASDRAAAHVDARGVYAQVMNRRETTTGERIDAQIGQIDWAAMGRKGEIDGGAEATDDEPSAEKPPDTRGSGEWAVQDSNLRPPACKAGALAS